MPNWREVMDVVAHVLGYDPDVLNLHGDYLQIAQYLKIKGKEGTVFSDPAVPISFARHER